MFWTDEQRLNMLALLLENVGMDVAVRLANQQGIQDAVVEALFRAYFTEGRDISSLGTLIDVVAEAGLDRGASAAVVSSDEGMEAPRVRVDGVPFFIINDKITLAGAQPAEAFLEAFGRAVTVTPLSASASAKRTCRP